jgi:transposase-like protein
VRTRACYLAVGVTCDGDREALGIWWQDSEGAKSWLAVLNDLRPRRSSGSPAAASDPGRSRDRFSSLLVAAEDRSAPGPSYAKATPWRNALMLFPRR